MSSISEALLHRARGWALLPVGLDKQPNHALIRATRGRPSWKQLVENPATRTRSAPGSNATPRPASACSRARCPGSPSSTSISPSAAPRSCRSRRPSEPAAAIGRSTPTSASRGRSRAKAFPWGELRGDGAVRRRAAQPASRAALSTRGRVLARRAWLADFSRERISRGLPPHIRSTCLRDSDPACPGALRMGSRDFADLERDEGVALRLAGALGVPEGVRPRRDVSRALLHPDRKPFRVSVALLGPLARALSRTGTRASTEPRRGCRSRRCGPVSPAAPARSPCPSSSSGSSGSRPKQGSSPPRPRPAPGLRRGRVPGAARASLAALARPARAV